MKRTIIILVMLMGMAGLSACVTDNLNISGASVSDKPEKMYEDVAVEDFKKVNISGNASSIVIRRSESENFNFITEIETPLVHISFAVTEMGKHSTLNS